MNCFSTERLIIRRYKEDDWKDLHEYLSNEEVVKYEPYEVYTEEASKEEVINRSKSNFFWAVCLKETKKVIGNIYFDQNGPDDFSTYEIGYVFNSNYWGKGYATEACREFLKYAFETRKAHRVMAECNPLNESSWKLLERLNMRREGCLLKNIYFKKDKNEAPIWSDTYLYAMLNSEYIKLNPHH